MIKPKFTIPPETLALIRRMGVLPSRVKAANARAIERIARACADRVKEKIETQDIRKAGMSPGWVAYKQRHALDPRELVATREYLESIQVKGKGVRAQVEADDVKRKLLEYGFKGRPGVPHWTPVLADLHKEVSKIVGEELEKALGGG